MTMAEFVNSSPESDGSGNSQSSRRTQTINIGRWSTVEDERLKEAVIKHGTRWIIVASEVSTRNSEQCAKRWNDNLNPDLDHSFWSGEEDKLLIRLVTMYGHNWKLITQSSFRSRSPLSLKNRYSLLMRRQKRESKRQQQARTRDNSTLTVINAPSLPQLPWSVDLDVGSDFTGTSLLPTQDDDSGAPCFSLHNEMLMPLDYGVGYTGKLPMNAPGTEQASCRPASDHNPTSLTTLKDIGEASGQNRPPEEIMAYRDWARPSLCENMDLDSLFSGTDMPLRLDGADNRVIESQRAPRPAKAKEQSLEVSITCSRSRLRAMVCHAFEGALRETRGLPEEEQVTVMLRFKTGNLFAS